jgi:DNA-binding GntR family transcriptional regulator
MDRKDFQEKLSKTQFEPLWTVVYQYLRYEIIVFRLKPNYKINEISIADTLGISRSPVKMAIQQLMQDGFIEKESRKRVWVAQIRDEDCKHLHRARLEIEGRAAYLAAKHINEEQLAKMLECVVQFENA